jgi:serine/threonine-protein kinase
MQARVIDGKYEIVRELSKGGMGAVYEARHLLTRRKVAVKLILSETLARKRPEDALRRFEREARAAGSIESRHVVAVLDTGIDSVTTDRYIVMELLQGGDLRELVRRVGSVPPRIVLSIAAQVCIGLRRAHEQGVIHRDIKSANIYLAHRDDGTVEVKVLDFGIAKLRADPLEGSDGDDLTRSGSMLGSPLYMSPEQATGSRLLDARSDIWSLGVVMYEALCGSTPHESGPLGAVVLAICSEPARPIRERAPAVPEDVAAIVHKALALEPSQRYASAQEMQAAIEACLPAGSHITVETLAALSSRSDEGTVERSVTQPAGTPPTETTVDAVTYGSSRAKYGASVVRPRLLVPIGVAIGLALLVWAARRAPTAHDARSTEERAAAATTSIAGESVPSTAPVPSPPKALVAPPSSQTQGPIAPPAARSAHSKEPRAARRDVRASAKPVMDAGSSVPLSSATPAVPSALPASPAAPAVAPEPTIDRHFE